MTMPAQLLALLQDPFDHAPLQLEGDTLINTVSQRRYPVLNSIPALLDPADLGPQNLKMQKMYQWMSRGFDLSDRLGNLFMRGALTRMRRLFAGKLGLKPGDRCLYTSIGTGLDLPYLAERVPLDQMELVGLDLSMGMLAQCSRKLRSCAQSTMLVQANAERLPFGNGVFDVVFHVGGINLFDHPAQAVREMIRVAKPGALLQIADETGKVVEEHYKKSPFTRAACKDARSDFDPRTWVPGEIPNPAYEEIWKGKGYILSFRAPTADPLTAPPPH